MCLKVLMAVEQKSKQQLETVLTFFYQKTQLKSR